MKFVEFLIRKKLIDLLKMYFVLKIYLYNVDLIETAKMLILF